MPRMSEAGRWFTSISGAVIFHVFLLFLVFLMLQAGVRQAQSMHAGAVAQPAKASEVTVMLGDLMEQLKVDIDVRRPTINADANEAEAEAPENARFESDRNTSAASLLQPNPNLPQLEGPTLAGEEKIPRISLFDQKLQQGELDAAQSAGSPSPPTIATASTADAQPEVSAPEPVTADSTAKEAAKEVDGFPQSAETEFEEATAPEDTQVADEVAEAESPKTFQPSLEETLGTKSMKIGSTETQPTAPERLKPGELQETKKQEGEGCRWGRQDPVFPTENATG